MTSHISQNTKKSPKQLQTYFLTSVASCQTGVSCLVLLVDSVKPQKTNICQYLLKSIRSQEEDVLETIAQHCRTPWRAQCHPKYRSRCRPAQQKPGQHISFYLGERKRKKAHFFVSSSKDNRVSFRRHFLFPWERKLQTLTIQLQKSWRQCSVPMVQHAISIIDVESCTNDLTWLDQEMCVSVSSFWRTSALDCSWPWLCCHIIVALDQWPFEKRRRLLYQQSNSTAMSEEDATPNISDVEDNTEEDSAAAQDTHVGVEDLILADLYKGFLQKEEVSKPLKGLESSSDLLTFWPACKPDSIWQSLRIFSGITKWSSRDSLSVKICRTKTVEATARSYRRIFECRSRQHYI